MNKQQMIAKFQSTLTNYDNLSTKSSWLPWLFGGSPGQVGLERKKRADKLSFLSDSTLTEDDVFYQICKFNTYDTSRCNF